MDLHWKIKPWGEATLIEIEGEVDLHGAPQLRAALTELGASPSARVALDLSGVSFLDSTGIGALVGALKKTRENGGQMAFFGARDRVKRVFQIAGLLGALPFYQTRDGALAALLPSPQFVASDGENAPQSVAQHGGGEAGD